MDFTSRMTALLSELRRERNGEVADTMRFYGRGCGLNLGVAIHTIRSIAAACERDNAFAEYLYRQDVRELRIAALWLAEPERVAPSSFAFWAAGIINSEIAEQAAMALFSKIPSADELIAEWGGSDDVLLAYTVLLTASRSTSCNAEAALAAIENIVERFPDNRLIGRGAAAAAAFVGQRASDALSRFVEHLRHHDTATARYVSDELSWLAEY